MITISDAVSRFFIERAGFPTRVRLETTRRGALVAYTGQRDDAEGGNQLFASALRCGFDL